MAVLQSTYTSLWAQLGTGTLGVLGLLQDVPPEHQPLQTALKIEMFVQMIELGFYVWFVQRFHLQTMAQNRYLDWFISTPLMLISLMIYFDYEYKQQEGIDTTDSVRQLFRDQRQTIATVLAANAAMLAFGYAGEMGWMSKTWSSVFGFLAFALTFSTVWQSASKSRNGRLLFPVTAGVWALYGVAATFPVSAKNIAFNGLDVIAKNLFGVFLSVKLLQK